MAARTKRRKRAKRRPPPVVCYVVRTSQGVWFSYYRIANCHVPRLATSFGEQWGGERLRFGRALGPFCSEGFGAMTGTHPARWREGRVYTITLTAAPGGVRFDREDY